MALDEFIRRELNATDAYEGEPGPRRGGQVFQQPRTLALPGDMPVRVVAVAWHGTLHCSTTAVERAVGAGALVAELALASVDGEVLGVLSNHQIERFGFLSDGTLLDRAVYERASPGA